MKYTMHIGFGNKLSDSFLCINEYIVKYGGIQFSPYFYPIIWDEDVNGTISFFTFDKCNIESNEFISDLKDMASFEKKLVRTFTQSNRKELISYFFDTKFNYYVNITNVDTATSLYVCLYVPLWDEKHVDSMLQCVEILNKSDNDYTLDIVGLTADTSLLFVEGVENIDDNAIVIQQQKQSVKKSVLEIKKRCTIQGSCVNNFIILQNKRIDGVSLNLDKELFVRILGEFVMLYIENYNDVLHSLSNENCQIKGIGFSAIHFDKFYFAEYLLSRTYLHILEREGVKSQSTNVNEIANTVNVILNKKFGNKINLFTDFWEKFVWPKIVENTNNELIVSEVLPEIETYITDLGNDLQQFLEEDKFSMPEKRAALASILGEDDELFDGEMYDPNVSIIDDCEFEAANLFVQFNNDCATDESKDNNLKVYAELDSEANEDGRVEIPLNEIKHLKMDMKNSTQTIRSLLKRMQSSFKSIEENNFAEKVLISGDVFQIGNYKFKLISKPIEEQLLDETYSPRNTTLPKEVDLRENFTEIKNQGDLGACTAFAAVGVYEFIANANAKRLDLSEGFVYYMSRSYENSTTEDSGSSIFNAIRSMSEFGVCERRDWNYDSLNYSVEPNDIAKENALKNKVTKAMNVCHKLNDLKSAIADGFPICFTLKIFESFGQSLRGFITRPKEEELRGDSNGYHAMVLCGYSDINKLFIVRNSWGKPFGDNGYCYIPYSYIEDENLFNQAFIINEISLGTKMKSSVKNVLNFDITDRLIQFAIDRNLLEEEKYKLDLTTTIYENLRRRYISINTMLTRIDTRNRLRDGEYIYLVKKIENLNMHKQNTIIERDKDLSQLHFITVKVMKWCVLGIGSIFVAFGLSFFLFNLKDVLLSEYFWLGLTIIGLLIVGLLIWFEYRKDKYRRTKRVWDEQIANIDEKIKSIVTEKDGLKLKSHIAGMIHNKMFDLKELISNKHKIMKSYVGNLVQWYDDENLKRKTMYPLAKTPFIGIIKNNVLDKYFNLNKDVITANIKLCDFINNYNLTEAGIIHFKKDLKDRVIEKILSFTNDFKIFNYIASEFVYPYLDNDFADITLLLNKMKIMSQVFIQPQPYAKNKEQLCILAIANPNDMITQKWQHAIVDSFTFPPLQIDLKAQDKILMIHLIELEVDELMVVD
jgi:C1A family cysteine protease